MHLTTGATTKPEQAAGAALGVGLVAAMVALTLFVWLGREVLTGGVTAMDHQIRALVHAYATPGRTAFMRGVSRWGSPSSLTPIGLVLAAAFLVRGWSRGALLAVLVLAGANLFVFLLKLLYSRARPSPFFDYPLPPSYSFPSGHALFAACFFGGLAVLLSHRLRPRWARALTWIAAVACIGVIGLSRVYLGVHYPSDVLGGWSVGLVWICAVTIGDRLIERRRRRREEAEWE